jgi:hypothetical protein
MTAPSGTTHKDPEIAGFDYDSIPSFSLYSLINAFEPDSSSQMQQWLFACR